MFLLITDQYKALKNDRGPTDGSSCLETAMQCSEMVAGEPAQQLRTNTALAEDLNLVSETLS